jgi:hypothetical protein
MNKIALVLSLALCGSLQAQTVWRCGSEGKVVYTDEPCATGRALTAADPRTPEQVQEARRVAQSEAQQAQRLVHDREARERAQAAQGSGLIGIGSGDRDLIKRSTTLAKKKAQKRGSRHLEAANTWPATARASRRTRD